MRESPTVLMALTLIVVYVSFGILGADLVNLNPDVAYPFVQVNELVLRGWLWMLFTSMFLHLNLVHLFGNVIFLLIFGTALEEQVSRTRWLAVYLSSGLAGNFVFLFFGPLLGQDIALGASGAVYGLLGAAGGTRAAFLVIFLFGLNIFAGGGFLAHISGLFVGFGLRKWGDSLASLLSYQSSEPSEL